MMGNTELFLLLFIILLLFGARKLPELAKGMGSAVKELILTRHEAKRMKKSTLLLMLQKSLG